VNTSEHSSDWTLGLAKAASFTQTALSPRAWHELPKEDRI
jgi:hypothetical protein